MAYLLSSLITIISLCSHQTISAPVSIENSDYKLSSDITYAIYNPVIRKYLSFGSITTNGVTGYYPVFVDSVSSDVEKWTIEIQKWGSFALKQKSTGKYIYYGSDHKKWRLQSAASAYNEMYMGFKAKLRNTGDLQDLPTIDLWTSKDAGTQHRVEAFSEKNLNGDYVSALCNTGNTFMMGWSEFTGVEEWWRPLYNPFCNGFMPAIYPDTGSGEFIFIPQTLPKNCEEITGSFSDPAAFDQVAVSLDDGISITHRNGASESETYSLPTTKHCEAFTTTFSQTSGSEQTKGFGIEVDMTTTASADAGVVSAETEMHIGANYHMDWKYYGETTQTNEHEEERCIEWGGEDPVCPARTICKKSVLVYKPTTDQADTTVTATCDGNKYEIKGKTSAAGIIKFEVKTTMEPLDCQYYTTDYNKFEKDTIQFCDTCNNAERCEICRDGYILLDGVCVTQNTCEYVCGGDTKGAGFLEDGSVPWSGAFCEINNPSKFTSEACQIQLGKI